MAFKRPEWLRPKEIVTFKYWLHVGILSAVALFSLPYITGFFSMIGLIPPVNTSNMLSIQNVLMSIPVIGFADIVAHSILKMD